MRRRIIFFTFLVGGLHPILPMLDGRGIPYPYLFLLLPGLVYGLPRFINQKGPWSALPVLATAALMLVGLTWTDATEFGRGALLFAAVATSLPIAALIHNSAEWRLGVNGFLVGSLVSFFVLTYYFVTTPRLDRLGTMYDSAGKRIMEPNDAAILMGFAVVVAFAILSAASFNKSKGEMVLLLGTCALLGAGVILSGSRGSLLALAVALGVVVLIRHWPKGAGFRLFWLVFGLCSFLAALVIVPNPVRDRFSIDSLMTASSRLPLWQSGVRALFSTVERLVFGAGTGSSDKALAVEVMKDPSITILSMDEGGVWRSNAHSTYFDWLLSYGLIGILVGVLLVWYLLLRAQQRDRLSRSAVGIGMISFFLVASLTMMATRLGAFSITGFALLVAYLGSKESSVSGSTVANYSADNEINSRAKFNDFDRRTLSTRTMGALHKSAPKYTSKTQEPR